MHDQLICFLDIDSFTYGLLTNTTLGMYISILGTTSKNDWKSNFWHSVHSFIDLRIKPLMLHWKAILLNSRIFGLPTTSKSKPSIHIYIYIWVWLYIYIYMYVYAWLDAYIYIYIHIYTYVYMYVYIHTYIYIYIIYTQI